MWQVEIRVSDLQRSIAFFSAVFDWQITPIDDAYAMIDTGLMPLVSLWAIDPEKLPYGVCHYVQSDDCVADAARAEAMGARIMLERSEVPGSGAWTDVLDPWGNELAFWQAETPGTPELEGSGANSLSWVELGASDYASAAQYYRALVGWQFEAVEGMVDYGVDMQHIPGLGLVGGERGAEHHGMTDYFTVSDIHAACAAITEHGGQIGELQDIGDGSLFTLFLDPDGNRFGVVQPAG
jgi:predicted enzyme related to lactoylglutathione lyase